MVQTSKKSVLFLRPTLSYGGADRVTLNLLQSFDRDKFQCSLCLFRREGEYLEKIPSDVELISFDSKSLWSAWKPLSKLLATTHFDVVYAMCGGSSMVMLIAAIKARYKGLRVVSERNILNPPTKSWLKRNTTLAIKALLYPRANLVTVVSKGIGEQCVRLLKVNKSKVRVVNNPIINQDLINGMKAPLDDAFYSKFDQVVLAVGRFDPQKNYEVLLKSFKQVLDKKPNLGLFILGKGPLEKQVTHFIDKLNINDHVKLGGFDVNPFRFMKHSSVYVLSSKHEGMPGTLVQAMGCGVACISTDCPTGPNELIENGFLVPVDNVDLLADRMSQLLESTELNLKFRVASPNAVLAYREEEAIESYFKILS